MCPELIGEQEIGERGRIIEAMISLVAESDYPSTTVELVVQQAGVSQADFGRLFKDKEDCFMAAYHQIIGEVAVPTFAAFHEPGSWREQFRAAAYASAEWLAEHPDHAKVGFMAELLKAPPAAIEHRQQAFTVMAELLDAGRAELEDPDEVPRSLAITLAGAILDVTTMRLARGEVDISEIVPQLLCMAFMPYLGREEALAELERATVERSS
jgi:AcrR family transcriptional regulator